ncbi:fungal hydrophobin [Pholiota conissans]|uniref:Hydrophobin n=1 Tax=Pholiota conissans TaxID=109636 RepID=A0A9P5Z6T3_9AGAR|nr:fungal hydrophobin [Pholiota conissans]
MQFKLSALATLTLASLAVATSVRRNGSPSNQCNTGSLQCCDSTSTASDPATAILLKSLGVVVQDVTALIGVTCSPITGVGVSGTSCSEQPVCCTDDSFNGVIALGCTPINVNL